MGPCPWQLPTGVRIRVSSCAVSGVCVLGAEIGVVDRIWWIVETQDGDYNMDTPRRCLLVTLVWCILQSSCPTFIRSDGVSAALSFIKPLTGLSTGSVQPVSTRPAAVAPSSTGASTANSTAFKARSSSGNAGRAGMGPWRPMSTGVEWSLRRVKSTPSLELIDAARESGAPPDASLYSPALRVSWTS